MPGGSRYSDYIEVKGWAMVEADYAQGELHSSRAPADSEWNTSYETEWMVRRGWRSVNHVSTSPLQDLPFPFYYFPTFYLFIHILYLILTGKHHQKYGNK